MYVEKRMYLRSEGLGESSVRYPDEALQELNHRLREGQLIGPLLYFCSAQVVLYHELGQVAHDLRGRSHLRDEDNRLIEGMTGNRFHLLITHRFG